MTMPPIPYAYQAIPIRAHDGDNIVVTLNLGFYVQLAAQHLRLIDCWAPELHEPDGPASRDYLQSLLDNLREPVLHVETKKVKRTGRDKRSFTRWLAKVWAVDDDNGHYCINTHMVDAGYASATRRPRDP